MDLVMDVSKRVGDFWIFTEEIEVVVFFVLFVICFIILIGVGDNFGLCYLCFKGN